MSKKINKTKKNNKKLKVITKQEKKEESFDILSHNYVPKFEIMSEEDSNALLEQLNISRMNLPKALSNDPAVKKLEAKINDILKITRKSYTSDTSVFYRVVVDA